MNFNINSTAKIYIVGLSFLKFPQMRFITTYEIIPSMIPSEIEYANGMVNKHINAGIASELSIKSIFLIGSIINIPTIISTGAVAAPGTERNNGEKNSDIMKQHAMENAVRPVRPPCDTPAALSTYVVVVEVPSIAPAVVAIASAMKACLR